MATLYQIDSGYFCAGVVTEKLSKASPAVITDAAPIVSYALGKTEQWFLGYCGRKGWQVICVDHCEGR